MMLQKSQEKVSFSVLTSNIGQFTQIKNSGSLVVWFCFENGVIMT